MSSHWYIVTNTENLIHFIHYGLIIDRQGFAKNNYLIDAMQDIPLGYVPCFAKDNIYPALQKAKEEDKNLSGCLLEIDVKQIEQMQTLGVFIEPTSSIINQQHNDITELLAAKNINCILLPAPLPFSLIKSITLQDTQTRDKVKAIYQQKFNTFAAKKSFYAVKPTLFKQPKTKSNIEDDIFGLEQNWNIEQRVLSYDKAFSYGGTLGLLYYQTKNGRQTVEIFNELMLNERIDGVNHNKDYLRSLVPLLTYITKSPNSKVDNEIELIYKRLIDELIHIDNHGVACEFILSVLQSDAIPEKYKDKCFKLSKSLEKIVERTNDKDPETILQLIINNLYPEDIDFKNFTLLITMFFLRDHIETVLKYHHQDFTERHYALIAIFFGLTSGIVNVPDEIRQTYELSTWISYKMAEYVHSLHASPVTFKNPTQPAILYTDYIKDKPTKIYKLHRFYEWLNNKLLQENHVANHQLVEWKISLPSTYTVENNKYLLSETKPDILASIDIAILEDYFQAKIKQDTLFNFNEITDAYKKYTK
ncbi:hypothetical protein [Psychrobacter sp. I-STPA10]|uniref:hypothetical protein n=1 Tax=Psychrobacter sp. I-STPA10 TaxID=2585769 RepID=UPI001E2C648B|nr:hypothetical protein [Psychrobacter sp. I-STPA10]